jgi:hypothetical protein
MTTSTQSTTLRWKARTPMARVLTRKRPGVGSSGCAMRCVPCVPWCAGGAGRRWIHMCSLKAACLLGDRFCTFTLHCRFGVLDEARPQHTVALRLPHVIQ